MSQATLSERPYVNANLFSGHYLDERVQERDEWDCDDDARDVLAILAARSVEPDVRIAAAATEAKHVDKFHTVGADQVVNPRSIGGTLLSRSVLEGPNPDTTLSALDEDSESED